MRLRPTTRLTLIAIIIVATAIVAGLVWYLGDIAPRMGQTIHTGEAAIGGPFSLTDQYGHTRSDKDFAGRYMLIYFGYTNCPDVCPTTLSVIADAMDKLGGDAKKVVPIFITVDPARDTPKALKSYMAAFGPEFIGLTGPMPSIKLVTKEYRVYFKAHKAGERHLRRRSFQHDLSDGPGRALHRQLHRDDGARQTRCRNQERDVVRPVRRAPQTVGRSTPACTQAAISVLRIRQTIVMAPTPPGTGVIAPATFAAAS